MNEIHDRYEGIGSSEIAAICGLDDFKSPIDVFNDKLRITPPVEENEAMWLGKAMERVLDDRYFIQTGLRPRFHPPIVHPDEPWRRGSPDRIVRIGKKKRKWKLLEYKTTGWRIGWGEPGSDEVPDKVACQVQWLLSLMPEIDEAEVPVYFLDRKREFQVYKLRRHEGIIKNLLEAGREFWYGHVVPGIPPALDGSEASRRYLNAIYPKDNLEMLLADQETEELILRLRNQKEVFESLKGMFETTKNQIKATIGEHAGIVSELGKIYWKKNKDSEAVDWKAAFEDLKSNFESSQPLYDWKGLIEAILETHTKTIPGARVFRTYFKGQKEDEDG